MEVPQSLINPNSISLIDKHTGTEYSANSTLLKPQCPFYLTHGSGNVKHISKGKFINVWPGYYRDSFLTLAYIFHEIHWFLTVKTEVSKN